VKKVLRNLQKSQKKNENVAGNTEDLTESGAETTPSSPPDQEEKGTSEENPAKPTDASEEQNAETTTGTDE